MSEPTSLFGTLGTTIGRGQPSTYERSKCAVFQRTKDPFYGLSNLSAMYPLDINGVNFLCAETLYQCCRYPQFKEAQQALIDELVPFAAKLKSKLYLANTRFDWHRVRMDIMRWTLRVKLAQNWESFGDLLLKTEDKPIVQQCSSNDFWGAKVVAEESLVGVNLLGRMLVDLREALKQDPENLQVVHPMKISNFLLMGQPIGIIHAACAELVVDGELDSSSNQVSQARFKAG